jgi:hypothetical protein
MDKRHLSFVPVPKGLLKPVVHPQPLLAIAHDPHIVQLNLLKAEVHLQVHDDLLADPQLSFVQFYLFRCQFDPATLHPAFADRLQIL